HCRTRGDISGLIAVKVVVRVGKGTKFGSGAFFKRDGAFPKPGKCGYGYAGKDSRCLRKARRDRLSIKRLAKGPARSFSQIQTAMGKAGRNILRFKRCLIRPPNMPFHTSGFMPFPRRNVSLCARTR